MNCTNQSIKNDKADNFVVVSEIVQPAGKKGSYNIMVKRKRGLTLSILSIFLTLLFNTNSWGTLKWVLTIHYKKVALIDASLEDMNCLIFTIKFVL